MLWNRIIRATGKEVDRKTHKNLKQKKDRKDLGRNRKASQRQEEIESHSGPDTTPWDEVD